MDKTEARQVLGEHLKGYRTCSHSDLSALVESKHVDALTAKAASGKEYHLEFSFFWDGKPAGDVRVVGSVCDGGWRCYFPLTESFILSPEGVFVGE
jgi:hypothetical protein